MITYEQIIKYPAGSAKRKELLEQWNIEYLTSLDTATTPTYHGSRKDIGENPISKANMKHNDYNTKPLWEALAKFKKIMNGIENAKYNPRNPQMKRLYESEMHYKHTLVLSARCWVQNFVDNIGAQVYMKEGNHRPILKWLLTGNKRKRHTLEDVMNTIAHHMVNELDSWDGGVENNLGLQLGNQKISEEPTHIGFNI